MDSTFFSPDFSLLGMALVPVAFWAGAYVLYALTSFRKSVPYVEFGYFVLLGAIAAFAAYILEHGLSALFGRVEIPFTFSLDSTLGFSLPIQDNETLLGVVVAGAILAFVSELFKYGVLWIFALRSLGYFSALEAAHLGIAVGLGFALAENYLVTRDFPEAAQNLGVLFPLRIFFSTFAHTLYGAILGYYFGLSKMHALYRYGFVSRGLLSAILLHSISNVFLALNQPFFAAALLAGVAYMLLRWYEDRRNFQQFLAHEEYGRIVPSFLGDRREMESQLFGGGGLTSERVRKLPFCPACFAKRKDMHSPCANCEFTFFASLDHTQNKV